MKAAWVAFGTLGATLAWGQAPDVRANLDLVGAFVSQYKGPQSLRLYDPLGRTSSLQLGVNLEDGLRAFVSERLQPIPNDPSTDPFEQYFIESPRVWHLGKQFVPFGSGRILRENVLAARLDTDLAYERLNLTAAVCDGGPGRQRGLTMRIGGNVGLSAAIGEHFGISPTSLDLIRRPEDSPGVGHGWGTVYGADAIHRSGTFVTRAEYVGLVRGATESDPNLSLFDISCSDQTDAKHSLTVGWTRQMPGVADFYRIQASIKEAPNLFFEPMLRLRDSRVYDLTLELRFRL